MPSKTALVLLNSVLPLNVIGLNRAYMGCYKTAIMKMLLVIMLFMTWDGDSTFTVLLLMAVMLWTLYDFLAVALNALSMSTRPVFCGDQLMWGGRADIFFAFWIALITSSIPLFLFGSLLISISIEGFDSAIDGLRNSMGMEKYVPSAERLKELWTIKKK